MELEKQMYEIAKKWLGYIGEHIDGGAVPDPTPTPEPTPEPDPIPTPSTKEPVVIYKGKTAYTLGVGDTTIITFYCMNSNDPQDFDYSGQNMFGGHPVFKRKLRQEKITNGFKFIFEITGFSEGNGSLTVGVKKNHELVNAVTVDINVQ